MFGQFKDIYIVIDIAYIHTKYKKVTADMLYILYMCVIYIYINSG